MNGYANLEEINNALSSTTFATLKDDFNENLQLISETKNFIYESSEKLVGDAWDQERKRLDKYCNVLEFKQQANEEISKLNIECLEMIKNYLEPYTDIDTEELDELEKTAIFIADEINELQNMMLEERTVEVLDSSGQIIETYTEPLYDIASLSSQIKELQYILDETDKLICKIKGFKHVLKQVKRKLKYGYKNIEDNYVRYAKSLTNSVTLLDIGLNIILGIPKLGEKIMDLGAKLAKGYMYTTAYANFGEAVAEQLMKDTNSFIERDLVGEWVSSIYKDDNNFLNKYSSLEDDERKNLRNVATVAGEIYIGAVVPGGQWISTIIGAGFGNIEASEELYENTGDVFMPKSAQTKFIIEKTITGGIEGYLAGNAGGEIHELLENVTTAGGVKNFVTDGITTIKTNGLTGEMRNLVKNLTSADSIVETSLGTVAGTLDDISEQTLTGNSPNVGDTIISLVKNGMEESLEQVIVLPGAVAGKVISPINDTRQSLGIDPIISRPSVEKLLQTILNNINNPETYMSSNINKNFANIDRSIH